MKKIAKCLVILFSVFLLDCVGPVGSTIYLVRRDVPQNISVSVYPYNYFSEFTFSIHSDAEIKYANWVEVLVIEAGVKVIQRPGLKLVKTTKQVSEGEVVENLGLTAGLTLDEYYREYTGPKPDYIILTYLKESRLRIIKRETGEVLGSLCTFEPADYRGSKEMFKQTLIELGIAKSSYMRR